MSLVIQIRNIPSLKDLDHQVRIDYLSLVRDGPTPEVRVSSSCRCAAERVFCPTAVHTGTYLPIYTSKYIYTCIYIYIYIYISKHLPRSTFVFISQPTPLASKCPLSIPYPSTCRIAFFPSYSFRMPSSCLSCLSSLFFANALFLFDFSLPKYRFFVIFHR